MTVFIVILFKTKSPQRIAFWCLGPGYLSITMMVVLSSVRVFMCVLICLQRLHVYGWLWFSVAKVSLLNHPQGVWVTCLATLSIVSVSMSYRCVGATPNLIFHPTYASCDCLPRHWRNIVLSSKHVKSKPRKKSGIVCMWNSFMF